MSASSVAAIASAYVPEIPILAWPVARWLLDNGLARSSAIAASSAAAHRGEKNAVVSVSRKLIVRLDAQMGGEPDLR